MEFLPPRRFVVARQLLLVNEELRIGFIVSRLMSHVMAGAIGRLPLRILTEDDLSRLRPGDIRWGMARSSSDVTEGKSVTDERFQDDIRNALRELLVRTDLK
jgi:hypothetical protein